MNKVWTSTKYNVSGECSAEKYSDDCIGESAGHAIERVKDHGGRDTKSHAEKEHVEVTQEDFKIISSHFENNRLERKITETLIKHERPSLNVQDQSVELELLN